MSDMDMKKKRKRQNTAGGGEPHLKFTYQPSKFQNTTFFMDKINVFSIYCNDSLRACCLKL